MKKYLVGILGGLIVLVGGIVWQWPDGQVHLVACDVGQGDGLVMWRGSAQAVVDGGPNDKIVNCLSRHVPFWDRQIELLVLTHPEADHLTGLIEVVKRYQVGQMVATGIAKDTAVFRELQKVVAEKGISVHLPMAGEKLRINGLEFIVLLPRERLGPQILGAKTETESVNDTSVVLKLAYADFTALLTGDISSKAEELLLNSGADLRSKVLKVAHHGSRFSSTEAFLEAVKPVIAVISVGKNNRYGHPTKEVLERLKDAGARIWRTDENGDVEIVSDGEKVWVK